MPTFDFDEPVTRRGTNCYKWDHRPEPYPDDILPMWVADMDFVTAPAVVKAVERRVAHPLFGYSFPSGSLHTAFAAWQSRRNGWEIDEHWIVDAEGIMPAVRAAIAGFTKPGDGVVVQSPTYMGFHDAITQNGRVVVENLLVEEDRRYRMDLDHLDRCFAAGARLLLLCSPHNPVGRVWSRSELAALAEVCLRHEVIVIADEIHSDLILGDAPFVPLASVGQKIAARTITGCSPSKSFNLAGLSSALFVVSDDSLRREFSAMVSRAGVIPYNPLSLTATEAAYSAGEEWLTALLSYLRGNVSHFARELSGLSCIGLSPVEGTYLGWLDFREIVAARGITGKRLRHALLHDGRIWLSQGELFGAGGPGHFRINLATRREVVSDAVRRIGSALESIG